MVTVSDRSLGSWGRNGRTRVREDDRRKEEGYTPCHIYGEYRKDSYLIREGTTKTESGVSVSLFSHKKKADISTLSLRTTTDCGVQVRLGPEFWGVDERYFGWGVSPARTKRGIIGYRTPVDGGRSTPRLRDQWSHPIPVVTSGQTSVVVVGRRCGPSLRDKT